MRAWMHVLRDAPVASLVMPKVIARMRMKRLKKGIQVLDT
jgi:hypothetical protein